MTSPKPPANPMMSAADLRKHALEHQLREIERSQGHKAAEAAKHAEFVDTFFDKKIGDDERALMKRLVMRAALDGKLEALIFSFPSDLCTDSGRAINNGSPAWEDTLQGKAKEVLELFQQVAKPKGYGLKGVIINFPAGMPGDVGLFLTWDPPIL
ncbi:hypothetical protein [Rhizobium sp. ZW T2_16]|uniref:hypothetical protein n=1 Tax=Rhizobium sp. ZW T2_16 TaxID=3378083 RepID=UPI003853DBAA